MMNRASKNQVQFGVRLGAVAMLFVACGGQASRDAELNGVGGENGGSNNSAAGTTNNTDDGGGVGTASNAGSASGGSNSGGSASAGEANGGTPNAGSANGGSANGGAPSAGAANGGSANGGSANAGATSAGSSNGGSSNGGVAGDDGAPNGGVAGASGGMAGSGGVGGAGGAACNPIVFADPNLEQAVRTQIRKPTGELTSADVASVQAFAAHVADIGSLAGIECLPLTSLDVANNRITDVSPLRVMSGLKSLVLSGNPIGDLTPLGGLAALENLTANGLVRPLRAEEIAGLAALPALRNLSLEESNLATVAPFGAAKSLRYFDLYLALLGDLESPARLTQLDSLELGSTGVQPNAVKGLTQLSVIGLSSNQITDISSLHSLHALTLLDLSDNKISDLSPVSEMPKLDSLFISGNQVSDLSPISSLPLLEELFFDNNAVTSFTPLAQSASVDSRSLVYVSGVHEQVNCSAETANIAAMTAHSVVFISDCPYLPPP